MSVSKNKEIEIRFGRNTKKAVIKYDKRGRATVSMKTTSGKKRSWVVK